MDDKLNQQQISFIKENLNRIEKAMVDGFAALHLKLEIMENHYVRREELDRALIRRDEQIRDMQDNQKWVVRTIIGIVIVALMGLIIINVKG